MRFRVSSTLRLRRARTSAGLTTALGGSGLGLGSIFGTGLGGGAFCSTISGLAITGSGFGSGAGSATGAGLGASTAGAGARFPELDLHRLRRAGSASARRTAAPASSSTCTAAASSDRGEAAGLAALLEERGGARSLLGLDLQPDALHALRAQVVHDLQHRLVAHVLVARRPARAPSDRWKIFGKSARVTGRSLDDRARRRRARAPSSERSSLMTTSSGTSLGWPALATEGRSMTPGVTSGAVTMKMTSSTSITST